MHGPEGDARTVRLQESPYIVGRSETVQLSLPEDTMLSRQHLAFEWTGTGWQVRDLGSKNGTSVNGVSLVREKPLEPGDKIVAGRLVMEYERGRATVSPRSSGPVEFIDDAGQGVKPDATVILRLDSARVSGVSTGTLAAAERTQKRMDALVRAGRELASFQPLDELFRVTLEVALDSVGAARGVLLVLEQGVLVAKAHQGEGFRVSSVVRDKVMGERSSLLVRDTEMDNLLKGSKTIAQQFTRSLMAVPLQTETQVIGILYVDSPGVVRPFDADDLGLLTVFANIAAIRIEHARLLEVEQAEQLMARELEQAADIQKGLFPAAPPNVPGWDLAGRSLPCHSVGGDYFDYLQMADGRLLVVVADVSGKGLAASLLMSSLQARVQALAELETDVALLVGRLNRSLRANTPVNKFITGFFAALDPATGAIEYSNAGHNPPVLARRGGGVEQLTAGGPVLGILPDIPYEKGKAKLEPGDCLVMFSDGVSEAPNVRDEEFGEEAVAQIATACIGRSADEVLMEIARQLSVFLGECSPVDDVTLMVARRV